MYLKPFKNFTYQNFTFFPPRKDGILHPRRVVLGLPSPSPRVCTDGRTYVRAYANVTTKISRIERLPNLLSNDAPLKLAFKKINLCLFGNCTSWVVISVLLFPQQCEICSPRFETRAHCLLRNVIGYPKELQTNRELNPTTFCELDGFAPNRPLLTIKVQHDTIQRPLSSIRVFQMIYTFKQWQIAI